MLPTIQTCPTGGHWWGRREALEFIDRATNLPGTAGVVVAGAPGVGKTRLVWEALARAGTVGRSTACSQATRSGAGIPFGALAHLLPAGIAGAGRRDLLRIAADSLPNSLLPGRSSSDRRRAPPRRSLGGPGPSACRDPTMRDRHHGTHRRVGPRFDHGPVEGRARPAAHPPGGGDRDLGRARPLEPRDRGAPRLSVRTVDNPPATARTRNSAHAAATSLLRYSWLGRRDLSSSPLRTSTQAMHSVAMCNAMRLFNASPKLMRSPFACMQRDATTRSPSALASPASRWGHCFGSPRPSSPDSLARATSRNRDQTSREMSSPLLRTGPDAWGTVSTRRRSERFRIPPSALWPGPRKEV